MPAVWRLRSRSTSATFEFAWSAATTSDSESAGTSIESIERGAMVLTTVAPAAAISSAWSEAVVSWEKVTMYGTEEGEEVVLAAEEEDVSVVEGVSVVLVSDELIEDAPVSVAPVDDSPSGEMPPNAPETNRPATKTAAIPSVPLTCHVCAFFFSRSVITPSASL